MYDKRFYCLYISYIQHITKYTTTVIRHYYVNNYFYRRIQLERVLHDAERDLLAIAKFLI